MKKFIFVLAALSLFFVVSASAAGTDDYTIDEDVELLSLSASDTGISTTSLTDEESAALSDIRLFTDIIQTYVIELLDEVTVIKGWNEDNWNELYSIWVRLGSIIEENRSNTTSVVASVQDVSAWVQNLYNVLTTSTGNPYLDSDGNISSLTVKSSVSDILTAGLVGLSVNLHDLLELPSGSYYLDQTGTLKYASSDLPLVRVLSSGFLGLNTSVVDHLTLDSGTRVLGSDGIATTLSSDTHAVNVMSDGFLGLRSLLAGVVDNNVYVGTLTNNDGSTTSFDATGLGPMVNYYLDAIQYGTGLLSYMFASPTDLDAKEKSESATQSVVDSFIDPEAAASLKEADISSLSSASKNIQALGATGVSPDLAFEQLGNADLFSFFTQETASDLDTRVQTLSDDPATEIVTNYYEESRNEFFELIGKGD